jgi:hypothetical protein
VKAPTPARRHRTGSEQISVGREARDAVAAVFSGVSCGSWEASAISKAGLASVLSARARARRGASGW